jgi:hypothetical protein
MTTTTPINGLRLAELSDAANMQTAMSNLGTDLDNRLIPRFATPSARDTAITAPVGGMVCWVSSFNNLMIYYTSYWGFLPGTPLALIYNDTSQSIESGGTGEAVSFQDEEFDYLGGHDTTTNNTRYTPSVPGRYNFIGGVAFDNSNSLGVRTCRFRKNGTGELLGPEGYVVARDNTDPQPPVSVSTSAFASLNGTTDYVELWAYQSSGVTLNIAPGAAADEYASMHVVYLGPS